MRSLVAVLVIGLATGCGDVDPSRSMAPDGLGVAADQEPLAGPDGPAPSTDALTGDADPHLPVDGGAGEDAAGTVADAAVAPEDLGLPGPDAGLPVDDGGLPPGPDAGEPPPPPPPAACPTFRLRHLQASMQRTDTLTQRNQSIDAAFDAGADTISWTEIENPSDTQRIDARQGWDTFWPSGKAEAVARNAVPISWRTDIFEFVHGRAWLASQGLAMVAPSEWVVRVWLRHKASGAIQSRVSHHAVPGVDGGFDPPVQWRMQAFAGDISRFKQVMNLDTVPVVGSGDFNTVRLRSLLGGSFRYDVPTSGGSHGARLIDWIVRRPHAELRFVRSVFLTVGNSDHRGVRAAYDYQPACQ
jgi:hypothetical protein